MWMMVVCMRSGVLVFRRPPPELLFHWAPLYISMHGMSVDVYCQHGALQATNVLPKAGHDDGRHLHPGD